MKKRLVSIILSAVILVALIVMGIYFIFMINTVSVYYNVLSDMGLQYSVEIQEELESLYKGKNILFISEDEAAAVFDKYPYVSEVSIRKVYPNKIAVYAEENAERFAVANSSGGYDMLDKNGLLLSSREKNENYADSYRNILLEGFGEYSEALYKSEQFAAVKVMCEYMHETFGGIRANLSEIKYAAPTSNPANAYFQLTMTEGVIIRIFNPLNMTEEKCVSAVERYLSLSPEDRLYGLITVVEKADDSGELITTYSDFVA